MSGSNVVFGLLSGPTGPGQVKLMEKLRSFTISWFRYGYHGPILEASTLRAILTEAINRGYRYCFIHSPGNAIMEPWTPSHWGRRDFHEALAAWIETEDFFITGQIRLSPSGGYGLGDQCLLVNLALYQEYGQPEYGSADDQPVSWMRGILNEEARDGGAVCSWLEPAADQAAGSAAFDGWNFIRCSLQHRKRVYQLPPWLTQSMVPLHTDCPEKNARFATYLDDGIAAYQLDAADERLTPAQNHFLTIVRKHTDRCRDGVFLWNVESYRDANERPETMTGPVSTLFSVAAGFKPNWILHTHGIDANTRVVFFDYSAKALAFRRILHQEWDGTDYPRFLEHVFRKLPSPDTCYHLWGGLRPEEMSSADFQQAWDNELERWGGAQTFKDHWQKYRRLRQEYVHCDILTEAVKLFENMGRAPNEVIWWSNAFFTVYSNWFHTLPERKLIYDAWVSGLADRNPGIILYGFDYNSIGVNGIQASEYALRYAKEGGNYLEPGKAYRLQIRC